MRPRPRPRPSKILKDSNFDFLQYGWHFREHLLARCCDCNTTSGTVACFKPQMLREAIQLCVKASYMMDLAPEYHLREISDIHINKIMHF